MPTPEPVPTHDCPEQPKPKRFRRLRKVVGWLSFLLLTTVVGALTFAYFYATDSATLAALVREHGPMYLPGCRVNVDRVRIHPFIGEVSLNNASVHQVEGLGIPYALARFQWIRLSFDPWAMLDGKFIPRQVVVTYPTVRLRRRLDGSWNLQDFRVQNLPKPSNGPIPPIRVLNGTVELVDESQPDSKAVVVLQDVSLDLNSDENGNLLGFNGSARGHVFDFVHLEGTIDKSTGRVELQGDVSHLAAAGAQRVPLPPEIRPMLDKVNLTAGEADLLIDSLVYDPKAEPRVTYDSTVRLHSGVWSPEFLPFTINDLDAAVKLKDGRAVIEWARGYNGPTSVKAGGWADFMGKTQGAFDLTLEVTALELDERLKIWTPEKFKKLWDDYKPSGRVNAAWRGARSGLDDPIDWGLGIGVRDASMEYHLFRYPVEHIHGELTCKPKWIEFKVESQVGGKPLTAVGRIDDPGPNPKLRIDFAAGALPIDDRLRNAMPPEVRKVVDSFSPAGTVRGTARLTRNKVAAGEDPKKAVLIDASLDLNPGCEMTWDGLRYKVSNMTGHLEIHPDRWDFRDMRGTHGQALIQGSGQVARIGPGAYDVGLHLNAENLLFDQQLRDALPTAWRKTWETLNPTGASDVEATITVKPGTRDNYRLVIHPRPETNLRLAFERLPEAGEADISPEARRLEMRLEDIAGTFIFDNGKVKLIDGGFFFRNSPVTFAEGEVQVFDSGKFSLHVQELYVKDFRLDAGLRKMMPPVMAQFARRLDDGKTFTMRSNLGLAWSGRLGEPVACSWNQGRVILNGNSVQAGVPIRFIQGEIQNLNGWFNGRELELKGALDLASVNLFDQQIRDISSPIEVSRGKAKLPDIQGRLLEGRLTGDLEITLDATPRFATHIAIEGAKLESYAKTLPGKQTFRGLVGGRVNLSGWGSDLHTLQGDGEAHVTQGDLGKIPGILRLFKVLQLAPNTKTAFDTADVTFNIRNGMTAFQPIRFTGDAFSLRGEGTLDPQGELDIKLGVVYGRDTWHLPVVTDAVRKAGSQIVEIRVGGTPASPDYKPVPLPGAAELIRSLRGRQTRRFDDPAPR